MSCSVFRGTRILMVLGVLLYSTAVAADEPISTPSQAMCPNAHIWGAGLVTNVCWPCLFPMRVMGSVQWKPGSVPANSADQLKCICSGSDGLPALGVPLGAWEPQILIELVRQPYCSPSLGGTRI